MKSRLRTYLGAAIDDPLYGDIAGIGVSPVLDVAVQDAVNGLIADIAEANPTYNCSYATLSPTDPVAQPNIYNITGTPFTSYPFARWLALRYDNQDGADLDEVRFNDLAGAGGQHFAVVTPDETAQIVLHSSELTTQLLWLLYGFWPLDLTSDSSSIVGIPSRFHDVVALEALFVYAVGGEAVRPPDLRQRWLDRRAQLIAHVSRRGTTPNRTRLRPESYL